MQAEVLWKPWHFHRTSGSHMWDSAPRHVGLKTGFWLWYLIAVLNSTELQTCRETGEQSCITTWEGWAGERLSLRLRNPVSLTDLTHSFKRGSKNLTVRFIRVCSLSRWWANTAANRNASILPLRGAEIQLSSTARACSSKALSPGSLLLLFLLPRSDFTSGMPRENPTADCCSDQEQDQAEEVMDCQSTHRTSKN